MVKTPIYFDHAATTPVDPKVLEKMLPYYTEVFGNPNSQHVFGRESVKAVDQARDTIAKIINAKPNEVYFTSGGSESDNWAITSAAYFGEKQGKKHIISSAFEHHAVLHTLKDLEKKGFLVTYLPVYENGIITNIVP